MENDTVEHINDDEAFERDLKTLHEGVITNINAVKKKLSSNWNPLLIAIPILAFILCGVFIGSVLIVSILAVFIAILTVIGAFYARYVIYASSCNIALKYANGTGRLDDVSKMRLSKIPYNETTLPSAKNIYDYAVSLMSEDWQELIPELELRIDKNYEEYNKSE